MLSGFRITPPGAGRQIEDSSSLIKLLSRGVKHKPTPFEAHGRRDRIDVGKGTRGLTSSPEGGRRFSRRGHPPDFCSIDAMKALRLLSTAEYAAADPGGGAGWVPAERRRTAMEYIAFDAHKRYTQVSVETEDGQRRYEGRIVHARGALQQFLESRERGSPVALETVGNWDLDRGRDRSGRPGPAVGPCAQGEAHAGHGEQDR